MGFISRPFGILLYWLNHFVGNYGWALILFTILVRVLLLPLAVKQQKSMQETQRIKPLMDEIRNKYKNDKEKLNEETMKLYKEHNVNPAGGCLPLLIQFPIIIGLYQVIIRPLTYMFSLPADTITLLTEKVNEALLAAGRPIIEGAMQAEIRVAQRLTPEILQAAGLGHIRPINFGFLGINLGDIPSLSYITILWIIPVLAALTTFLSTKIASQQNPDAGAADSAMSTMKTMNMIFPLMTAWFAFSVPAGVGLYWIIGNIIQMGQQVLLTRYFKAKAASDPLVIQPSATKVKKPNKGGGRKK